MSLFMFGVTSEELSEMEVTRRHKIAQKIGGKVCGFRYIYPEGGEQARGWFYKPTTNTRIDGKIARKILEACGIEGSCSRVSEKPKQRFLKYAPHLHLDLLNFIDSAVEKAYREIAEGYRETTPNEAELLDILSKFIGK